MLWIRKWGWRYLLLFGLGTLCVLLHRPLWTRYLTCVMFGVLLHQLGLFGD